MKHLIIFGVLYVAIAVAVVGARPSIDDDAAAQILQSDFTNDGVNPWHHSLELSNGIKNDATGQIVRQGEEDESIAVRGTYSHLGSNGKLYIVDYVADENGFQTRVRA